MKDITSEMTILQRIEAGVYSIPAHTPHSSQQESYLIRKFRDDTAKSFDVSGHPKEPLLWEMAWEKGHAYGLAEVYAEYEGLVWLIK